MHELEHLAVPSAPRRYRGADPSAPVIVEIDATAHDAQLVLLEGWRTQVGVHRLGPAVVQAFTAATTARLAAWAATGPEWTASCCSSAGDGPQRERSLADEVQAPDRAWRDLREFRIRLAELRSTDITVTAGGGRVRATVRDGRLLAVELDRSWSSTASDADVAVQVGRALRAALFTVDEVPGRALDACPDLRALLDRAPVPTHCRGPR
jgi:hypothetical protein